MIEPDLTPHQLTVLHYREACDMPWWRIAKFMEIPPSDVRRVYKGAISRLRAWRYRQARKAIGL